MWWSSFLMETAQKILRVGYFWHTIFKDCIDTIKKCHPSRIYTRKMHTHPAPLHHVVTVGPFLKWAIDYMTINPPSSNGHHYIIVAVDYFTKWDEAIPTFDNMIKTATYFLFNHVITRFGVLKEIVTDNGSHFRNSFMDELTTKLGLWQYFS